MPAGFATNLSNFRNIVSKRQHIIIMLVFLVMLFLVFAKRIFRSETYTSLPIITLCFLMIITIIIASSFTQALKEGHKKHASADTFASLFNSPGSKNFIATIALMLFIAFIYETSEYGNNEPYTLLDKITMGRNNYISNRLVGFFLIITLGLFSAYTIYSTSVEFD